MKPRYFISLAIGAVLSALTCSAATLIVDDFGTSTVSSDASAPQSSFKLINLELSPDVHTPFFRDSISGLPDSRREISDSPWLKTGYMTLDSTDFAIDSPLASAKISRVAAPNAANPPAACATCAAASAPQSTESTSARPQVTYTLVMTSFPRDAEGVYTNAIYFNRKDAHQPYAILMLREGLAAVEPLEVH